MLNRGLGPQIVPLFCLGGAAVLYTLGGAAPVNPPVRAPRQVEAHVNIPADVQRTLRKACYDCHSNETAWPWYSRVFPVSELVRRDVLRGREAMNFSDWPSSARRGAGWLIAACEDLRQNRMPKAPYPLLNPGARLSPGERTSFCEWAQLEAKAILRRGHEAEHGLDVQRGSIDPGLVAANQRPDAAPSSRR